MWRTPSTSPTSITVWKSTRRRVDAIQDERAVNLISPQVDHDLDSFSKRLHDETLVVAREVAPPGTRCRDYWITERKFVARNGSKRKKKKRTGEGYFKQVSEKLVTYHDEL